MKTNLVVNPITFKELVNSEKTFLQHASSLNVWNEKKYEQQSKDIFLVEKTGNLENVLKTLNQEGLIPVTPNYMWGMVLQNNFRQLKNNIVSLGDGYIIGETKIFSCIRYTKDAIIISSCVIDISKISKDRLDNWNIPVCQA